MIESQPQRRARSEAVGAGKKERMVERPATEHLAQVEEPFQRRSEVVIGLVGDMIEQRVLRGKAPHASPFESAGHRAGPELLLGESEPPRQAEPPVKFETHLTRAGSPHLEAAEPLFVSRLFPRVPPAGQ